MKGLSTRGKRVTAYPVKPGGSLAFMIHVFPAEVRLWNFAYLADADTEM
jgi:hypothetical protein